MTQDMLAAAEARYDACCERLCPTLRMRNADLPHSRRAARTAVYALRMALGELAQLRRAAQVAEARPWTRPDLPLALRHAFVPDAALFTHPLAEDDMDEADDAALSAGMDALRGALAVLTTLGPPTHRPSTQRGCHAAATDVRAALAHLWAAQRGLEG